MMGHGLHLMVDGRREGPLAVPEAERFLVTLVGRVNMQVIAGPYVAVTPNGLAGAVVLAESHAMVHQEGAHVFAEIFSCREFDPELVAAWMIEALGLTGAQTQALRRGWLVEV